MILENKVVIISGASKRFGEATANLFLKEGAKVIILSRNDERIRDITTKTNGKILGIKCDVTNRDEVKKSLERVAEIYGKIDVLFNNAGGKYSKKQKMYEMEYDFWDEVIKTNLKSLFVLSKEVIPYMQKGGSIINISAANKTLLDSNTAYAAAKSGIIGLTKNLARELREYNIRVNCIRPGVIRTEFDSRNFEEMPSEIKRKGVSEDVAHAALYLASNNSSWITGQTFVVDGGESLFLDMERV